MDIDVNGVDTFAGASDTLGSANGAAIAAYINNGSIGFHAFYSGSPANAYEQAMATDLASAHDDLILYTTGTPTNPNGFFNFDFSGFNGSAADTFGPVTVGNVTVVPEPTALAFVVMGAAGLLGRRRR